MAWSASSCEAEFYYLHRILVLDRPSPDQTQTRAKHSPLIGSPGQMKQQYIIILLKILPLVQELSSSSQAFFQWIIRENVQCSLGLCLFPIFKRSLCLSLLMYSTTHTRALVVPFFVKGLSCPMAGVYLWQLLQRIEVPSVPWRITCLGPISVIHCSNQQGRTRPTVSNLACE